MQNSPITTMPVTVYGEVERFNDVISKARCRIFYLNGNRNRSWITEEFANKLLSTLPYAPIKGIYDEGSNDFLDHGSNRRQGRIYGIVSANPNVAWEEHVDEDGITRTYACADVLLYTALYDEAKDIVGKAQSMELYPPSISGSWQLKDDGKEYFVFTDACFLGLQVLGNEVPPAFEGASFYNLTDLASATDTFMKLIDIFSEVFDSMTGGQKVDYLFNVADENEHAAIWAALNASNENDQHNLNLVPVEISESTILAYNLSEKKFVSVSYEINAETNEITLGEITDRATVLMSADENAAMQENFAQTSTQLAEATEQNAQLSARILELENTISTSQVEQDNVSAAYAQLQETYAAQTAELIKVTTERDALAAYRKEVELAQKKAVLDSYVNQLSDTVLSEYEAHIDEYSVESLDKELTYALKKSNPGLFNSQTTPIIVFKDEPQNNDIDSILSKYEKK